jgi:hypothetical protein
MESPPQSYPGRFRRTENLHIVFWLFKDLSWCLHLRVLGALMILPTFVVSLAITWRARHIVSELCHNVAVTFWIIANSYWMLCEFLHVEDRPLGEHLAMKHLAVIPFALGIGTLGYYYLYHRLLRKRADPETLPL